MCVLQGLHVRPEEHVKTAPQVRRVSLDADREGRVVYLDVEHLGAHAGRHLRGKQTRPVVRARE